MSGEPQITIPPSGMQRLSQQEAAIRTRPVALASSDWLCHAIGRAFAARDNDAWMIDSNMEDQ